MVTSVSPLRIFRFEDGLVRFATIKYEVPNASNIGSLKQHLTNYSINKDSEEFDDDVSRYNLSLCGAVWAVYICTPSWCAQKRPMMMPNKRASGKGKDNRTEKSCLSFVCCSNVC